MEYHISYDLVLMEEGYTPPLDVEETVEIPTIDKSFKLVFKRGEKVIVKVKGRDRALKVEDLKRLLELRRASRKKE